MKILISLLTILFFTVSAFGALPIKTVVLTTAMSLYQACKTYQESWDTDTLTAVGNLNRGKTTWNAGESFKYFQIIGIYSDGTKYLLPEVDFAKLQITNVGIYTCDQLCELLQISKEVFRVSNPAISCP